MEKTSAKWGTIRRLFWRGLRVGGPVALVLAVAYWIRFAPTSVLEKRIERGEIIAEVMGTGTLEARVKTTISSKISGRIAAVFVDQGDRVKMGQLLVHLDDDELKQQVAIAQANCEAAQAAIERLKADKNRATAVVTQAIAYHARIQTLVERKAATTEDLDKATESLALADAGLSSTEAAITEGQKELVAAEKTLEYHRARLADTEIKAAIDGLIVQRRRDPGDIVVPGSPILTLISTDELWISAWVDETEISRLQESLPARVVFRSEPGHSYRGSVVRLGREADRETREFIVDVRVVELPKNWAVGQRAEVYIETDHKESVILLPTKFLELRENRPGVFIDQNRYAQWRPLTLGLRNTEMVEVREGLEPGETVVTPNDPRDSLRDGQRIVTP